MEVHFQTARADQNILLIIHDCQFYLFLLIIKFLLYLKKNSVEYESEVR